MTLIVGFVRHGEWVLLALWLFGGMCISIWVLPGTRKRHVAQNIIRMVNTTYWMTGPITAVYWMIFLPMYILITGHLPVDFNAQAMMIGGILMQAFQWIITSQVKTWAKAEEQHLWRSQQAWFALWPLNLLGIPKLVSKNSSWQISAVQAQATFCINSIELLGLVGALIYAVLNIHSRVSDMTGTASMLVGFFTAVYSLLLLFPTTSYLFNSIIRGKKHTFNISSRHLLGGFMIASLIVFGIYVSDWALSFSLFFSIGTPTWLNSPSTLFVKQTEKI